MRVIKDLFGKIYLFRCLSKISAIMVVAMLMAYYCPQMAFENVLAATVTTTPIVYDVHVTNQVYGSSSYVPLKVRTNATDATVLSYNNVYAYYTYLTANDNGYATYNANAEGTTVSTASTYKWQSSPDNSAWTDISGKTGLITAAGCMGNTAGNASTVGSAKFTLSDTYANKYIRCIITPKDSLSNVGASVTTPAVYVKQDAAALLTSSILPSADANTESAYPDYHYGTATNYSFKNDLGRYPFLKFNISSFSLPTNLIAANEAVKSAVVRFYASSNGNTGTAISAYDISSKYSSWTESTTTSSSGAISSVSTDLTFNTAVTAGILNANKTINTATLPTADTTTSYTIPYKGAANNYFYDINVKPIVTNNTSRSDNTISFMLSGAGGLTVYSKERGYNSSITQQLPILIINKITGISVSGTPTKTVYNKYDTIDISGITVTASYADGSTNTVTIPNDSGHILGFDGSKVGSGTASVSYGGCTATLFNYTVNSTSKVEAERLINLIPNSTADLTFADVLTVKTAKMYADDAIADGVSVVGIDKLNISVAIIEKLQSWVNISSLYTTDVIAKVGQNQGLINMRNNVGQASAWAYDESDIVTKYSNGIVGYGNLNFQFGGLTSNNKQVITLDKDTTIPVTQGVYKQIDFAVSGGNWFPVDAGGATHDVTLTFSDGTTQPTTLNFPNFISTTVANNIIYSNNNSMLQDSSANGTFTNITGYTPKIYLSSITIPQGKVVTDVVVAGGAGAQRLSRIFAVTMTGYSRDEEKTVVQNYIDNLYTNNNATVDDVKQIYNLMNDAISKGATFDQSYIDKFNTIKTGKDLWVDNLVSTKTGESITVNASSVNLSNATDAYVIVGVFSADGKTLLNTYIKTISLANGSNAINETFAQIDNGYTKLFVWQKDNIKPLCISKLVN